jgi:outer membrane protein OmpA-like peptidoglycan-associated protein
MSFLNLAARIVFPVAALCMASAFAADVAGSKDPPFLKRYEGSEIISYQSLSYEAYNVSLPDEAKPNTWKWRPVEGQVTRIFYKVPGGHTVLEIYRNYEQALKEAGIAIQTFNSSFQDRDWADTLYHQGWQVQSDNAWTNLGLASMQRMACLGGTGNYKGQAVTVMVFMGNYKEPKDVNYAKPVHFNPDNVVVIVDVVMSKAVVNKMVTIKAADMADELAKKGVVSIYGIYFDTDKSDIKPSSDATLDEVANLLKIDRGLKLEISGHTDNTGDKAHNAKLSEARAQAVVHSLVAKYGIDAKRLAAKGYGDSKPVAPNDTEDNKAKNRRVELKKI